MLSVWAISLRRSSCYAARKSSALAYLSDKPIESISARTRASMPLSYPSMLAISRSIWESSMATPSLGKVFPRTGHIIPAGPVAFPYYTSPFAPSQAEARFSSGLHRMWRRVY